MPKGVTITHANPAGKVLKKELRAVFADQIFP